MRNAEARIHQALTDYPSQFWVLMAASLIDMTGGWMLFPFFSLYFTDRFGVSMAQVGVFLGIFSTGMLAGSALGGALADRVGRKPVLLLGLVASASSSVGLGLVVDFRAAYCLTFLAGAFGEIGAPAYQAMIADLLPEAQRSNGYGINRMVLNVAAAIGPMLGGMLANTSFLFLFLVDAVTSLFMAGIVLSAVEETRPAHASTASSESLVQAFRGYRVVLQDLAYMAFLMISTLASVVYLQLQISLPVFMRDSLGFRPGQYGTLLALNALMVVLLQLWITRWVSKLPPMRVMAAATLLYAVGFGAFGVAAAYGVFAAAIAVITIGEMAWVPTWQATSVKFAPKAYRGRYLAVSSLILVLPGMVGPGLAGMAMDAFGGRFVWYAGALLCLLGAAGYRWVEKSQFSEITNG